MLELKNKRTLNAKHFNDNGKFVMHAHAGAIHYYNKLGVGDGEKRFREIDHKLYFDDIKRGWYFEYHSYHPFIPEYSDGFVEFRDLFDDKDQIIKYKAVCNRVKGELIEKDETNPNFDDNKDNKAVLYRDAFEKGKDYLIYNTRSSLVKVATVNNPNEQKEDVEFTWEVELPKQQEKELPILRARTKEDLEKLDKKVDNKFLSYSLKLDTEKIFDSDKQTLLGEDKKDGKEWFTYLRTYRAWDSEGNTTTIQVRLYEKDGRRYLEKTIPVEFLKRAIGRVFTDTTTSYYAGAGDGTIRGAASTWDSVHDATSASDYLNYTGANMYIQQLYNGSDYRIGRIFIPVDTSALPDSTTISSASLYLYTRSLTDENNESIYIVQASQASTSQLVADDFDECGAVNNPTKGDAGVNIGATTQYYEHVLNSIGIGWISKTGYTKFGARFDSDINDTAITSSTESSVEIGASEQTGTDKDPYLSVTYTEATSTFTPKVIMF